MRVIALHALGLVATALALGCVEGVDESAMVYDPAMLEDLVLNASPFGELGASDRDGDCMDDAVEHTLAMSFRPTFVFDSREDARLPGEPVVLFQAHTGRTAGACERAPDTVEVTYAYLFREDGGYPASTFCADRHHGDNQYLRLVFEVRDGGIRLSLRRVVNWNYTWPEHGMLVEDHRHPVIFLSAGKHHPYFAHAGVDGRASAYSSYGCTEAMDARGDRVPAQLESPSAPSVSLNVGESARHPEDVFVNDLGPLGFVGERAWGTAPFCGGRDRICGEGNNSMAAIWR